MVKPVGSIVILHFLVLFAWAQSPDELAHEVEDKHGVYIKKADAEHGADDPMFRDFLEKFLTVADKKGLSEGDTRRFFPVNLRVEVFRENFWEGANFFGYDLSINGVHTSVLLDAGHRSAASVVSLLIENFPLEGTEAAFDLRLRREAIRRAIDDRMEYLHAQGVEVTSYYNRAIMYVNSSGITIKTCRYSLNPWCKIENWQSVDYFERDKVLQGLITLADNIENGSEDRKRINITSLFSHYFNRIGRDSYPWDAWSEQDDERFEEVLQKYMERLRPEVIVRAEREERRRIFRRDHKEGSCIFPQTCVSPEPVF